MIKIVRVHWLCVRFATTLRYNVIEALGRVRGVQETGTSIQGTYLQVRSREGEKQKKKNAIISILCTIGSIAPICTTILPSARELANVLQNLRIPEGWAAGKVVIDVRANTCQRGGSSSSCIGTLLSTCSKLLEGWLAGVSESSSKKKYEEDTADEKINKCSSILRVFDFRSGPLGQKSTWGYVMKTDILAFPSKGAAL